MPERLSFRAQDLLWVVLFAALAAFGPARSATGVALLLAIGLFQLAEPRVAWFRSKRGVAAAITVKLAFCYALIGWTGGVASSYYWVLLLPVITAATALGLGGLMLAILAACAGYLSFLVFLDWRHQYIPPDQVRELVLRVCIFPVAGFLSHQLAEDKRLEARKHQAAAQQLAEANRHLQEAEAAMRRSERLAALGQLSAGLAHEIRNPLGTVKASAEMLLKNVSQENDLAREVAGFISTEVDRTDSLITRFLDFARPLALRRETADIARVLDDSIAEFERHHSRLGVTVYRNYAPEIRPVPLDPELMQRVFYNLLLNAAQASPPQGTITVKTRQLEANIVEIAIIDRGAGIDPKHRESIFNPFFTSKPHGVGLGLAIVSKIVDEHGGSIAVESELGSGSIFRIHLRNAA